MAIAIIVKSILVLFSTFLVLFFVYLASQSHVDTTFQNPDPLRFYAKPHLSFLEKIAAYRERQSEQERACKFPSSNETCSFKLLQDYQQQCGYFSTKTSWGNITGGFPFASMHSDICIMPKVENLTTPANDLHDYVTHHNISHVVIFGDSQGKRYNFALQTLFTSADYRCSIIKFENPGFEFGMDYFIEDVDPSLVLPVNRTCQSCASVLSNCTHAQGKSVLVEYISMIMNANTKIMADENFCKNRTHPICTVTSQQELVLQHYFNKQNYPELLLLFTTFAHDRERPFAGLDQGMRHLLDIIYSHVPSTSTIIWYTTTPFHERKMYPELKNLIAENGYHVNQKIDALNHLLFHLLRPHLRSHRHHPTMYGFFDLFHLQLELEQAWALDWVHSQPPWYQFVLSYTCRMLAML